jgi:hypothetical protein
MDLEVAAAKKLKAKLLSLGEDEDDLVRDMIEGETKLHEAIARVAFELAAVEGEAAGIRGAIKTMSERLDRHEARAEKLREAIFEAMQVAEQTTMKTPAATLSVRPTPSKVEIIDQASIPAAFMRQADPVPDKQLIKSMLQAGKAVDGCTLSNGGLTLAVKFT